MQNRDNACGALVFNDMEYLILYENTTATSKWTTAYRMDELHHVHLLQQTDNLQFGTSSQMTMHLHYSDIKKIFLRVLQEETFSER